MNLLLATGNPDKAREIRRVLSGMSLNLQSLPDVLDPSTAQPEETGTTFAENAAIKARYYNALTGLPTVAEDSGLVIDALGGRPGVLSARYPGATYPHKFANLYRELSSHSRPWTARFVCAIAFVDQASGVRPEAYIAEASVEGEIAAEPRGTRGFGYDPIFLYPPYGRTLGEVTDEEKLAVSHRGRAFREFRIWLEKQLDGQT